MRRKIVEACVEAYAETGFYGTTMKDVATRAGISHTGLLHHFPSKEELLEAVLEYRDAMSAALVTRSDPVETLEALIRLEVANLRTPGLVELNCVLSAEATSPSHPGHEHYRARFASARSLLERALGELADEGRLRAGADPHAMAVMFLGLASGLQQQWLFDRQSVDLEASLSAFVRSIVT